MFRILVALVCMMGFARADSWSRPPLDRYEGRTIVTGTDMRSRPAGMAACLADVLAKVSGDASILEDPRVSSLHADRLAADYDYVDRMGGLPHRDEEGSSDRPFWLTVRFDPARLDAALRELGRAPHEGPRPTVVPLVTVRGPVLLFVLAADGARGADHRAAFAAASDRVGMPLRIPSAAEAAQGLAEGSDVMPLHGELGWSDAEHGWIADWDAAWQGESRRWQARGVSFDEAYRVGLRGALGLVSGHPMGDARH